MKTTVTLNKSVVHYGVKVKSDSLNGYIKVTDDKLILSLDEVTVYKTKNGAERLKNRAVHWDKLSSMKFNDISYELEVISIDVSSRIHPTDVFEVPRKKNTRKKESLGSSKEEIIRKKATQIIVEQLCVDKKKISGQSTIDSLGGDSLDAIEVIMMIEDEFDVSIPDEFVLKLQTLDSIVNYLTDIKKLDLVIR